MVLLDLDDGRCLLHKRFGFLPLRWHPRYAFVLQASPLCVCLFAGIRVTVFAVQASPLCGAAPTFLCRRKEK
jgi:hypothetical protein